MRRTVPSRLLVYIGLFYVVFCWALNTVFVKQAVAEIDPLAFTFMRFIVMTPLAFLLVRMAKQRVHVERRDVAALVVCGACGYGIYQYFWIIGLSRTTAFASALLGAMAPVFTLAIVSAMKIERVRSGRWLGTLIAFLGIAVFEGAFSGAAAVRTGDVLTLAAALTFAGYNVVSAKLLDRYTPLELLAITMAIGTLMIAPGGIPALMHTNVAHLSAGVWWRLLFAIAFPVLLTYPVWSYGITRLGAGRASIFSFLVPVLAGVMSVPLLHSRFTAYELIGAGICLCGMLLANVLGKVSLVSVWSQRTLPLER